MIDHIRNLRIARDAARAKVNDLVTKADWLDMTRSNSRYGGISAESALRDVFLARAKLAETERALQAAIVGMGFIERVLAQYTDEELRAEGWKVAEMRAELDAA